MSSPFADDGTWDTLLVADTKFLGVAEVKGSGLGRRIDASSPSGADGATLRDRGYEPWRGTITLRSWDEDTYQSLEEVCELFRAAIRVRGQAIAVSHPQLARQGVAQVVCENVGDLEERDGVWECQLKLIEHRTPRPIRRRTGGSARVQAGPDLGANATAFDGLEAAPAPSTTITGPAARTQFASWE